MAEYRIGQVAKQMGIATSAIRYYESAGLLPEPPRSSGHRVYDSRVLDRLRLIETAKRAGFSISEIKRLLAGVSKGKPPGPRWRALTERKLADLDARIAEAERMKEVLATIRACACPTFEDCKERLRASTGS